jgi:hypothetical protein
MTERARRLLETYDHLSAEEQVDCARAILKRQARKSLAAALKRLDAHRGPLAALTDLELSEICKDLRRGAAADHASHR